MKYVLFDLETELQEGPLNLDRRVPGITVAATLTGEDAPGVSSPGEGDLKLWYEQGEDGQATGQTLGRERAAALEGYLADLAQAGYTIVTWNGAGFDFRVLAHASGLEAACVELSWAQVDMMFWLHCSKGFSVQLAKAAEAAGSAKTEGISGADAPRLWAEGQHERVLGYVAQDVRALGAVYVAATRRGELRWINARGRVSRAGGRLLAVRDAFQLPQPDTSWMRRVPWPRKKFVGWMLE